MHPGTSRRRDRHPGRRCARSPASGCDAVVVEPHQRDHVADVLVVAELASRQLRRVPVDRVRADTTGIPELLPDLAREAEVRNAIPIKVADLLTANAEAPFAALAHARLDAR